MRWRLPGALGLALGFWAGCSQEGSERAPTLLAAGAPGTMCVRGDCRGGTGLLARLGGESYAGEFRNGLPNGTGAILYPGGWDRGAPSGTGRETQPMGRGR